MIFKTRVRPDLALGVGGVLDAHPRPDSPVQRQRKFSDVNLPERERGGRGDMWRLRPIG